MNEYKVVLKSSVSRRCVNNVCVVVLCVVYLVHL